jgi:hypothetical protein
VTVAEIGRGARGAVAGEMEQGGLGCGGGQWAVLSRIALLGLQVPYIVRVMNGKRARDVLTSRGTRTALILLTADRSSVDGYSV